MLRVGALASLVREQPGQGVSLSRLGHCPVWGRPGLSAALGEHSQERRGSLWEEALVPLRWTRLETANAELRKSRQASLLLSKACLALASIFTSRLPALPEPQAPRAARPLQSPERTSRLSPLLGPGGQVLAEEEGSHGA